MLGQELELLRVALVIFLFITLSDRARDGELLSCNAITTLLYGQRLLIIMPRKKHNCYIWWKFYSEQHVNFLHKHVDLLITDHSDYSEHIRYEILISFLAVTDTFLTLIDSFLTVIDSVLIATDTMASIACLHSQFKLNFTE